MGILKEPAQFVKDLKLPAGFSVCELGNQMMAGGAMGVPAEPFYRKLGCGRYESIDANGNGTYTHDLNTPLPWVVPGPDRKWFERFDLVTDFGTGEHIFDQAQVWRTLHTLTKPGGVLLIDRPSFGYETHGYYVLTRELIEDIARANAYHMIWGAERPTPRGTLLGVAFRRTSLEPFRVPQQSRYRKSLVIP